MADRSNWQLLLVLYALLLAGRSPRHGRRLQGGVARLSSRERLVAGEFASGRTHREIAEALGVSPATVRNQLQSVYAKLGVRSKIQLARRLALL